MGCWTDMASAHSHILKELVYDRDRSLTIGKCLVKCDDFSYSMADLEDGWECWCGNGIQSPTYNKPAGLGQYVIKCAGNQTEICGSSGFSSLYQYTFPEVQWLRLLC